MSTVIARRTITVDGNLDDWQGVIPQTSAQTVGISQTEKAYLPFENWDARAAAARSPPGWPTTTSSSTSPPRCRGWTACIRYETRNDDEFFYPEKVTSKGKELTWPAGVRRFSYRKDFDIPSGNGKHNVQIAFNVIPPEKKGLPAVSRRAPCRASAPTSTRTTSSP